MFKLYTRDLTEFPCEWKEILGFTGFSTYATCWKVGQALYRELAPSIQIAMAWNSKTPSNDPLNYDLIYRS